MISHTLTKPGSLKLIWIVGLIFHSSLSSCRTRSPINATSTKNAAISSPSSNEKLPLGTTLRFISGRPIASSCLAGNGKLEIFKKTKGTDNFIEIIDSSERWLDFLRNYFHYDPEDLLNLSLSSAITDFERDLLSITPSRYTPFLIVAGKRKSGKFEIASSQLRPNIAGQAESNSPTNDNKQLENDTKVQNDYVGITQYCGHKSVKALFAGAAFIDIVPIKFTNKSQAEVDRFYKDVMIKIGDNSETINSISTYFGGVFPEYKSWFLSDDGLITSTTPSGDPKLFSNSIKLKLSMIETIDERIQSKLTSLNSQNNQSNNAFYSIDTTSKSGVYWSSLTGYTSQSERASFHSIGIAPFVVYEWLGETAPNSGKDPWVSFLNAEFEMKRNVRSLGECFAKVQSTSAKILFFKENKANFPNDGGNDADLKIENLNRKIKNLGVEFSSCVKFGKCLNVNVQSCG